MYFYYHIMSEINKNLGKITETISEHGAPVIEQLLDKLTGKGAQIKYSFQDLKVDMPAATKPDGKTVKGGRFNVNGTITISAKVIPVEDKDLQTKRYNTRASQTDYSIPDAQTTNTSEYTNEESLRNYNSNQSNPV
jgi:hypothetical protein